MGINVDIVKENKYKWGAEMPRRTVSKARQNKIGHDHNGFPHYSSITGECMCLDTCCHRDGGCICKPCPCDKKVGHISGLICAVPKGHYDGTRAKE